MDYMKLRLAIYESYGNGEMTSEACSHLIDHLDEKYGESIVEEAVNAENDFINASLKVFTESAGEEVLTEAAKDFGAKIKAAWEKFKAWIKKIIEKILNLGKKPEQQKSKIQVPKALDKALSDAKKWIAKLGGAKTVGAMVAAVAGIVASTAAIVKNRKLKETMGAKVYEYEKFKKEQAELVKQMQDAALKAQNEIDNLNASRKGWKDTAKEAYGELGDAEDKIKKLNAELTETKKKLATARARLHNKTEDLKSAKNEQGVSDSLINNLLDDKERLEKELADAKVKKSEASKQSKPAESGNTSDEKVTDSKILSASTGLVNAVTQTVVALLPQYSSKTTDDIDSKLPGNVEKRHHFYSVKPSYHIMPSRDLTVLNDSGRSNRFDHVMNYIEDMIGTISDEELKTKCQNKFEEACGDITDYEIDLRKDIDAKLKSEYNLATAEGVKKFANDYSLNQGLVAKLISNALNNQKKFVTAATLKKYEGRPSTVFDLNKFNAAISDYINLSKAKHLASETYDAIHYYASDAKKSVKPILSQKDKMDFYSSRY